MNSEETFYVIPDAEGSMQRWKIQRTDVDLLPEFTSELCSDMVRSTYRVAKSDNPDFGLISLCITSEWVMYSVRVKRLHITSRFTLRDGVMRWTPMQATAPMATLVWVPPADMRLMFGIMAAVSPTDIAMQTTYLVGMHDGRRYVLPMPNLFADGKLCHGQPTQRDETGLAMVSRMAGHLQQSPWNADLYTMEQQAHTDALFQWKPLDDGTFEQLPTESTPHWTTHCKKVASAVVDSIMEAQ